VGDDRNIAQLGSRGIGHVSGLKQGKKAAHGIGRTRRLLEAKHSKQEFVKR
jgi:hypothetical protein